MYVAGIPQVYISVVVVAPSCIICITNSHIMSAHKTLSKTERRRRWQRRSTNIYVIILYIGFLYIFPTVYLLLFFLLAVQPSVTREDVEKLLYAQYESRTYYYDTIILLCDGAIWRLYTHIIIYVPSRKILYIGHVIAEEHIITIGGRPTGI